MHEIFEGQDRISTALTSALTEDLNIEYVDADATTRYVPVPEAYDLYLRGRQIWHRRGSVSMQQAIDSFAESVKVDPMFARGWAALASAYISYPSYSPKGFATWHLAEEVAQKAVELDPNLSEPYGVLGTFAQSRMEWEQAGRLFAEGVRLNDRSTTAHHWYAEFLLQIGHISESLRHTQRAMELDPVYIQPQADVAWTHLLFGDPATAETIFLRLWNEGFQGPEGWVGNLLSNMMLGNTNVAQEWIEIAPGAENVNDFLNRLVAVHTGVADDEGLLDEILALNGPRPDHRTIIWTAALLGEYETLFDFLNGRIEQGRSVDTMMLWGPVSKMRDQPGFIELINNLGLIDYWDLAGWGEVCRLQDNTVICDARDVSLDMVDAK